MEEAAIGQPTPVDVGIHHTVQFAKAKIVTNRGLLITTITWRSYLKVREYEALDKKTESIQSVISSEGWTERRSAIEGPNPRLH